MSFVKQIADRAGLMTAEELLVELIDRFANRTDFSLSPRVVARVLWEVHDDIQKGKALHAASQQPAAPQPATEATETQEPAK